MYLTATSVRKLKSKIVDYSCILLNIGSVENEAGLIILVGLSLFKPGVVKLFFKIGGNNPPPPNLSKDKLKKPEMCPDSNTEHFLKHL